MVKIAPSILSADFTRLGDEITKIQQAGAEYIHIDVMDGTYVPNISFGIPVIQAIRPLTKQIFDVHLMVEEPIRYIEDFAAAGSDIITVHPEACGHLHRTLGKIKEYGCKTGVALNPDTPIACLEYVLEEVDMILVMSVNPGFGGQAFISSAFGKIQDLREMLDRKQCFAEIAVDGGVNAENAKLLKDAGASVLVAGSALFTGDLEENIRKLRDIVQ